MHDQQKHKKFPGVRAKSNFTPARHSPVSIGCRLTYPGDSLNSVARSYKLLPVTGIEVVHGGAFGRGTGLQWRKVAGSIPDGLIEIFQ